MNAVHERTEIFEVQSFLSEPILKFSLRYFFMGNSPHRVIVRFYCGGFVAL